MKWDVFISHASEDKDRIARPLANLLTQAGLRVWIDENELRLGDSLRRKIEQGLAESRYGVVILSQAFFAKDWPQRELDALTSLETPKRKVILPVWDGIDHQLVSTRSPLLADKLSISTHRGLNQVALEILKVVKSSDTANYDAWDLLSERRSKDSPAGELFNNPKLLVGQSIDSYVLLEFLGSGGSGVVFSAQHKSLGRKRAVKILYPLNTPVENFYPLFKRGFRALGALNHPNIVAIEDFGEVKVANSDTFYLAMELIQGESLDTWSKKLGGEETSSFVKRLAAAIKLAEALESAHETSYTDEVGFQVRGVLHGDLKPSNVLVTTSDDIKLLDFLLIDIQRLLDPRVVPFEFLRQEIPITAALGTPGFMAPEQENEGIVTVQSDIYGLGTTFCYLFFPSEYEPRYSLFKDESFPDKLKKLLVQMIDSCPRSRPSSMRQVVTTLQELFKEYQRGPKKRLSKWFPFR
jgi:serine/threonine protein kinase